MRARIYKPAKTAMQSGRAKTKKWLLEFEPESPREIEPLMGWTSSSDMRQQVRLWFATKDDALAYASRKGIDAKVVEDNPKHPPRPKSYSDNFNFKRRGQWTH